MIKAGLTVSKAVAKGMKNSKKIKRVRIYNEPLYVRDEHDPKVLTPYKKKHVWW